jgi:uncharacterized protein
MATTISAAAARRIALAAQGFGRAKPAAVGTRQLNDVVGGLGLLQLDSVNVFERSHYLPVFARLGSFDKANLDRLTFASRSDYTEYWAHEAALIPLTDWPLFHWRMEAYRDYYASRPGSWMHGNERHISWVLDELRANGPLAASQIDDDSRQGKSGWWEWSDTKHALEYLFRVGEVVSAGRTRFERTYALPEQKIPAALLSESVSADEAVRRLIEKSARAHGIGSLRDLADYYRIKQGPAKAAVLSLVDEGALVPVTVEGWKVPGWLHRDARIPRRIEATALLSPFDPVVWERDRALRMFGFHYRIEIYTPAPKRQFGYYSLPVLVDDTIVGRIDLKSDRKQRVLRVQSAWHEEGVPPAVAERVAPVLREAALWQGLEEVSVANWGNLAPALAAELGLNALVDNN